jgi:hypothetical protein
VVRLRPRSRYTRSIEIAVPLQGHQTRPAGDTIENIAFGARVDRSFSRLEPPINVLIGEVDRVRPKAVLLSGGGNDVAGEQFVGSLNHAEAGLPRLREALVRDVIHGVIRKAYERIAAEVWNVSPSIAILAHGYAYAIPDGRAVFNFPFGYLNEHIGT